jgi:hypothetical protein
MGKGVRAHLRGNAVGYVALFVALSGTTYAAATISSHDVVNDSLKSIDLKNGAAVKSKDVFDDSLSGADVDEATLEGVNAAQLDGRSRLDYVFRSGIDAPIARRDNVVFYAYTMITPEAGTDYVFGQIKLRSTSNPSEFQVCGATGLPDPIQYVLSIEGVRSEDSVAGDGCDSAVNFGDRCDFEVEASGARVFGTTTFLAGTNCEVLALQAT